MNKVDKALVFAAADKFEQVKATFRTLFQSYVQDKSNPISERLMVWECYATDALLMADYRGEADEEIEELFAEVAKSFGYLIAPCIPMNFVTN